MILTSIIILLLALIGLVHSISDTDVTNQCLSSSINNLGNQLENKGNSSLTDAKCKVDNGVCFDLVPNGNGTIEGIHLCSNEFSEVDDVIEKYCWKIVQLMNSPHIKESQCDRGQGARLITHTGVRVFDLNKDILPGERVYVVPQGLVFEWPLSSVGNVIVARNIQSPIEGKQIRLIQLSQQPRVFQVENFFTEAEADEILEKNMERMTPSEVGFAGWVDKEGTRTSSTSWDNFSRVSKIIQDRTFRFLAMDTDPKLTDTLQVLRYEPGQWYKPHTDYFDADGYDGNDPTVNNGTNRFATMFLYLSTVEEGGHTVFPHSTSHAGYNGEKLVHDGTIDTPGYIDTKEAKYCCNATSTALRSPAIRLNAALFYSQLPDGSLDPYSLHGGCPPIKGTKWSANVWVWNRPSPDKSKAKDRPTKNSDDEVKEEGIVVRFVNSSPNNMPIELFWDPNFDEEPEDGSKASDHYISQGVIGSKKMQPLNTYEGHVFHAFQNGEKKFTYVVKSDDNDSRITIKW